MYALSRLYMISQISQKKKKKIPTSFSLSLPSTKVDNEGLPTLMESQMQKVEIKLNTYGGIANFQSSSIIASNT